MTDTDIKNDIVQIIEGSNERMPVSWIVQSVMSQHAAAEGPDKEFYDWCAHNHVRAVVRSTLQRMRGEESEEVSEQTILPGFQRLQRRYIINHNGEQMAVPIENMSLAEIDQKLSELERQLSGQVVHIREFKRYRAERAGMTA